MKIRWIIQDAIKAILAILCIFLAPGGGYYYYYLQTHDGDSLFAGCVTHIGNGGVSCLDVSKTPVSPTKVIKILFLGNSFTFFNNFPDQIIEIASSDPHNTIQLQIQSVTRPAIHLIELFKDVDASRILASQKWDYVVLQEYSAWTTFGGESSDEAYAGISQWSWLIRKAKAQPVLLENWSDRPGSAQYTDDHYRLFGRDPDAVQEEIRKDSDAISKQLDIPLAPVGDYWAYVRKQPGFPNLYHIDGHHPGPVGAYLTALVLYRYFTGNKPLDETYFPSDLKPEQAQYLKELLSR